MEIIQITRTISGNNYDNLSATANLTSGDDFIECAKSLDIKIKTAMKQIENQSSEAIEKNREVRTSISILERAIEYAKKEELEIPF